MDLDKEWTHGNLMKFHRVKCKVLQLCWGKPLYQCKLQDEGIESSTAESEKDLVLVYERLDMSQQCALTAQIGSCILGCIQSSMPSRRRRGMDSVPLPCSHETPSGTQHPALGTPAQRGHWPLGAGLEENHDEDQKTGAFLLWGKAEEAVVFQPGEEKGSGIPCCCLAT